MDLKWICSETQFFTAYKFWIPPKSGVHKAHWIRTTTVEHIWSTVLNLKLHWNNYKLSKQAPQKTSSDSAHLQCMKLLPIQRNWGIEQINYAQTLWKFWHFKTFDCDFRESWKGDFWEKGNKRGGTQLCIFILSFRAIKIL